MLGKPGRACPASTRLESLQRCAGIGHLRNQCGPSADTRDRRSRIVQSGTTRHGPGGNAERDCIPRRPGVLRDIADVSPRQVPDRRSAPRRKIRHRATVTAPKKRQHAPTALPPDRLTARTEAFRSQQPAGSGVTAAGSTRLDPSSRMTSRDCEVLQRELWFFWCQSEKRLLRIAASASVATIRSARSRDEERRNEPEPTTAPGVAHRAPPHRTPVRLLLPRRAVFPTYRRAMSTPVPHPSRWMSAEPQAGITERDCRLRCALAVFPRPPPALCAPLLSRRRTRGQPRRPCPPAAPHLPSSAEYPALQDGPDAGRSARAALPAGVPA